MTMEQYLERVSLERIEEIRLKIAERLSTIKQRGGASSKSERRGRHLETSSDFDDAAFREDNWEFLMIHTSKRTDDSVALTGLPASTGLVARDQVQK
jgi:hypothetical protein